MKLRIRSLKTKETTKIDIADSSSLLHLKTLIASKLSSSLTPVSPQSITLSLNRKDHLTSSGSLQSVGLTSGDLLFFSYTDPPTQSEPQIEPSSDPIQDMEVETLNEPPLIEKPIETIETDTALMEKPTEALETDTASMEKPCFLKRVMELEKDEIKTNLGFLVVAVHTVFLESGFVVFGGDGPCLPKDWNLATTGVSVNYTVAELVETMREKSVKFATLKFSVMRNHVSVYGFLSGEPEIYRLHLDLSKVVPLLMFLAEEEKGVFEFWRTVKDGLCLPLLIDICEKNGLPPPPCFARLPTELKMKVLELLPGVDVAGLGCCSSEMRYLASNDELWKQKYGEEFGGRGNVLEMGRVASWKEMFKRSWVKRRDAEKARRTMLESNRNAYQRRFMPRYPPFAPQRFPYVGGDYDRFPVIGGDHDMFPGAGDRGPMGPRLGFPRLPVRRNFSPHCTLGGNGGNFLG